MNAAQGIEDRKSKEYEYGGKNNEQNEGRQLVSDGQGKHLCRHLQHEGSTRDIISVEAKGSGERHTLARLRVNTATTIATRLRAP